MTPDGSSHRLERRVHRTLLAGLAVGGGLLAAGLAVALIGGERRPEGPPPGLLDVVRGAARGRGVDLLDLGLLALMVTPSLRVLVLAVGWGLDGQARFAATAAVVLALLVAGIALGTG